MFDESHNGVDIQRKVVNLNVLITFVHLDLLKNVLTLNYFFCKVLFENLIKNPKVSVFNFKKLQRIWNDMHYEMV